MRRQPGSIRIALVFAAFLGALSVVTWRQSRALEVLRELEAVRERRALVEAERIQLQRRVQALESRARVVSEARDRLGMRLPSGTEIVILRRDAPVPSEREGGGAPAGGGWWAALLPDRSAEDRSGRAVEFGGLSTTEVRVAGPSFGAGYAAEVE